jgi:CheY-like chemotaxis protein
MDYDLLMLDLNLPRVDGITILRHLRTRKPSMPILVLTSRKSGGRPSAMPGSRRRRLHGQAIFICRAVGQNPRAAEKEPLT